MTTCTPGGLPYAEGSDNPCDLADTSCAFAEAVEAQLDALDAIVTRTTAVPFALMSASGTQNYDTTLFSYTPFFDTVLADTDNMIDMSLDDTSLYINTSGVYSFFYSIELTLPLGGFTNLQISPLVFNINNSQISGNTDYFIGNFPAANVMPAGSSGTRIDNNAITGEFILNAPATSRYAFLIVATGALVPVPIHKIRAGALWLRDPL